MKSLIASLFIAFLATAADPPDIAGRGTSRAPIAYEFATVHFSEERTSITWPDGRAQNVMDTVGKKKFPGGEYYPKGSDYRMYWLTAAMNIMGREGFDFVHMHDNDVVMKRPIRQP